MEEYTIFKINIHRTLTPKPYHTAKIGLELEKSYSNLQEGEIEEKFNILYVKLKKSLNQIEQYELERMKSSTLAFPNKK